MRTIRNIASILLLVPLLLTACVRELLPEVNNGSDGWVLSFSAAPALDVVVSTKGTMTDSKTEDSVYNLYVMVFDAAGNKVSGKYFDEDDKVSGTPGVDKWTYTRDTRTGKINLESAKSSTTNSADCKIIVIANLNSEMVNITPAQLSNVASLSALRSVSAMLLQEITSRSGYFPMVGILDHVNLTGSTMTFSETNPKLSLDRFDARIEFNVTASSAAADGIVNFTPLTWQVFNIPRYSSILSDGTIIPMEGKPKYFDGEETNFETQTLTGETYPVKEKEGDGDIKVCKHGFSFYMQENCPDDPVDPPTSYAERDRYKKNTDGTYIKDENGNPIHEFAHADKWATYVVLKGKLVTKINGVINHAEVKYIIHLGNFGDSSDSENGAYTDFDILRNHHYVYNITIQGVEKIRAEAQPGGVESDSGASGQIVVPVREIFTCDSHYSTIALDFYYTDIQADKMAWWVRTPFSGGVKSDGNGQIIGTDRVDCEWVEFRVNEKADDSNYLPNVWTTYKPRKGTKANNDDTVDVDNDVTYTIPGLMTYLLAQKTKFETDLENYTGEATDVWTSDFDHLYTDPEPNTSLDADAALAAAKEYIKQHAKITVTAFVNEYYYEEHPTQSWNATQNRDLWRYFVNQPQRVMCILSSGDQTSKDGDSVEETATYIIQQHSIQSVYNVNSTMIQSAWGAEYEIDAREALCIDYWSTTNAQNRYNDNAEDGRRNSMIEWDLMGTDYSNPAFRETEYETGKKRGDLSWDTYLDLTNGTDGASYMKSTYKYLRYSCMSRNRDNNGNGKIDKDEVRWYMAASNQLINLFLGSYGIEGPAALYQRNEEQRESNTKADWRQHVLGSNRTATKTNSNKAVRTVWAEECLTGSDMEYGWKGNNDQTYNFSVRCVRNLGYVTVTDPETYEGDITYSPEWVSPEPLIVVTPRKLNGDEYLGDWGVTDGTAYKDVYFDVDCSRVNEKSRRYFTDRELAPHNELAAEACLYEFFQTTTVNESIPLPKSISVENMNKNIDSSGENAYCPAGYRLPNIREAGILKYYLDEKPVLEKYLGGTGNSNITVVRTYSSFGKKGIGGKPGNTDSYRSGWWGWSIRSNKAQKDQSSVSTRCVKDTRTYNQAHQ